MTITYSNGTVREAVVLARRDDLLRVAIEGDDDVQTFMRASDVWISEDCEPVTIRFQWQYTAAAKVPTENDCLCSKQLAAQLIAGLLAGSDWEEPVTNDSYALTENGNAHSNPRQLQVQ